MPKPVCVTCNTANSLLWRVSGGGHLCHECYLIESGTDLAKTAVPVSEAADAEEVKTEAEPAPTPTPAPTSSTKSAKKSGNRWTRSRSSAALNSGTSGSQKTPHSMRGRGRRTIFKKTPFKAPSSTITIVSSDSVYYNGMYMQVGDIVSMIDVEGDTYYAQIRGFLTDQYCEKSAVVTWLLPTTASPPPAQCFDPATYIIGPEEDLPRKLECMEFVMHAPSDYYKCNNTPYPPVESEIVSKAVGGYIWTSMESKYK